jgi:hypothetical protein
VRDKDTRGQARETPAAQRLAQFDRGASPESTVRESSFCAISNPWSAQQCFAFDSGEEGARQNLCDLSCGTVRRSALTLDHESCSPPRLRAIEWSALFSEMLAALKTCEDDTETL